MKQNAFLCFPSSFSAFSRFQTSLSHFLFVSILSWSFLSLFLCCTEIPQLIEQFTAIQMAQKYQCLNGAGQQVYWSQENSEVCARQCCGSSRSFVIDIISPTGQVAMKLQRPLRCKSAWCCILPLFCCCQQDLEVRDSMDQIIGHVVQKTSLTPYYDLVDGNRELLGHLSGPFFICNCAGDITFDIFAPHSKAPIGTVIKVGLSSSLLFSFFLSVFPCLSLF